MGRVRVRVGAICVICRGEGLTIEGRGDIRGEG